MTAVPIIGLPDQFSGVLVGTAVGDALGLPAEGLSRGRIQRKWHGECSVVRDDRLMAIDSQEKNRF
jgi:ADP-ribosylglycohydrolase